MLLWRSHFITKYFLLFSFQGVFSLRSIGFIFFIMLCLLFYFWDTLYVQKHMYLYLFTNYI